MVKTANQRAVELVRPWNSGNKLDYRFLAPLELPTVRRRPEHQTGVRGRVLTDWISHDGEAVIPIKGGDLQLDLHSELDVNGRRREFVLSRCHLDYLDTLICRLHVQSQGGHHQHQNAQTADEI